MSSTPTRRVASRRKVARGDLVGTGGLDRTDALKPTVQGYVGFLSSSDRPEVPRVAQVVLTLELELPSTALSVRAGP